MIVVRIPLLKKQEIGHKIGDKYKNIRNVAFKNIWTSRNDC